VRCPFHSLTGDQDREEAVAVVEPHLLRAAHEDVDLLAEEGVLEGEARAVGRERADEGEQLEEQAHRRRIGDPRR